MSLVDEVITAKAEENKNVYDADREYFILEKIKRTEKLQYEPAIHSIYKEIMKRSREYQEKIALNSDFSFHT